VVPLHGRRHTGGGKLSARATYDDEAGQEEKAHSIFLGRAVYGYEYGWDDAA
jgi:hypothetical protein